MSVRLSFMHFCIIKLSEVNEYTEAVYDTVQRKIEKNSSKEIHKGR